MCLSNFGIRYVNRFVAVIESLALGVTEDNACFQKLIK